MGIIGTVVMCLGVIGLLGVLLFLAIFGQMIFIDKISSLAVKRMKDIEWQDAAFLISEEKHSLAPLPYEYRPSAGDVKEARRIVLTPDNQLKNEVRVFDQDPNREVLILDKTEALPAKIFHRNDIFSVQGEQLGAVLHQFENPSLQVLRYVGGLNQDWFLLVGDPEGGPHTNSKLWQVSHQDYSSHLLTDKPYYSFSRPPRVFLPESFPGVVLVYYMESVDFGFGGDSSRPKYSMVRLFTDEYPAGRNVAQFSFRAGTIVDVRYENGYLTFYGDPSIPGSNKRLPPRLWKVEKQKI